jgi:hypothetical protein
LEKIFLGCGLLITITFLMYKDKIVLNINGLIFALFILGAFSFVL